MADTSAPATPGSVERDKSFVPADLSRVVNLLDFDALAAERMEPAAFAYYAGGAWDEVTLAENTAAFRRRTLRPRVLVDVSAVDLRTTLLGAEVSMPVGVAPTAMQGLAHPEGELATFRAAAAAGLCFCLSTVSYRSLEEVASAAPTGLRWFQLYVLHDRAFAASLVERAAAAGYRALVATVDLPVLGARERDIRLGFDIEMPLGNLVGAQASDDLGEVLEARHVGLAWEDLAWLRSLSSMPLVVKGILTAEDARLAVEHGAAALVVSNHGGRQLDRAPATIDVLEEVVAAVGGRAEVYLDGGVRRGTDVLIALALGARAVFLGRPVLYALASAGEAGVAHAFGLLRGELERGMALLGTPSVADVTRAHAGQQAVPRSSPGAS
jgi:isopentenyl diphosphate isomerase/L-lactate dehydrogenase-like FMN-dependent dehydrogenase